MMPVVAGILIIAKAAVRHIRQLADLRSSVMDADHGLCPKRGMSGASATYDLLGK
ncbi:MAG: hypothetical protein KDD77_07660 [Caldilineaceae bacterium]|nr:hypothetical protein [Caldilineaceae bacterium]